MSTRKREEGWVHEFLDSILIHKFAKVLVLMSIHVNIYQLQYMSRKKISTNAVTVQGIMSVGTLI